MAGEPTRAERHLDALRRFLGGYLTPRELVGLLLGRLGARLLVGVAPAILAWQWDRAETEAFAEAMGGMLFVGSLIGSGPEKATAKLLPRHPELRPGLVRGMLAAAVVFTALGAVWAGGLAIGGHHPVLVALGFLFLASRGAHRCLLAVSRAERAPLVDLHSHLVLLPGVVAGMAIGVATGSAESTLVVWLLASSASVVVAGRDVAGRTPGPGAGPDPVVRFRSRIRRFVLAEAVRLSVGDVATAVAATLVVLVLGWLGTAGEVADFYICLSLVSVLLNGLSVLFRLIQPSVSARYVSAGRVRDDGDEGRLARLWPLAAAYLAVTAVAAVTATQVAPGHHLPVTLIAAVVAGPLLTLASTAHFWFENRNRAALRRTNLGAFAGAAATALVAAPLTAGVGGVGAMLALTVGSVTHLAVLGTTGAAHRRATAMVVP